MARTGKARLIAEDWIGAALAAMGRGGVRAVSVEALAAELGATKGSFYWFFSNREALVTAALERWCESTTLELASELDALPDAEARLREMVRITLADSPWRGIEVALQADLEMPLVRRILTQVDQRRLTILQELHTAAGSDTVDARQAALSSYATWLGFLQLQRTDPDLVPSGAERAAYLESMLAGRFGSHASHRADKPRRRPAGRIEAMLAEPDQLPPLWFSLALGSGRRRTTGAVAGRGGHRLGQSTFRPYISPSGSAMSSIRAPSGSWKYTEVPLSSW